MTRSLRKCTQDLLFPILPPQQIPLPPGPFPLTGHSVFQAPAGSPRLLSAAPVRAPLQGFSAGCTGIPYGAVHLFRRFHAQERSPRSRNPVLSPRFTAAASGALPAGVPSLSGSALTFFPLQNRRPEMKKIEKIPKKGVDRAGKICYLKPIKPM